ncbi:hypothetical protein AHF37_10453 [Paragonimus kellicotti]|nr:hypothetical protein AHF37_10453 [Paragonimus kellicotti]
MHLRQGDKKPFIDPTHHTLIGHRFCPYVQRVRYTLHYHGIKYDPIYVALDAKPSWFLELYPTGKVPVLITNQGKVIGESIVIMKFLDSLCDPDASLLERCGEAEFVKAGDYISKGLSLLVLSLPIRYLTPSFAYFNTLVCSLFRRDWTSSGPKLSLADLLLLPHLDFLEPTLAYADSVEVAHVKEFDTNDPHYRLWPKLIDYMQTMRNLPFVMECRNPVSAVARYWESMHSGHPNPDF